MKNEGSRHAVLLCGSAFVALFAQQAHAQTTVPEEPAASSSTPPAEIVVTGSRIVRPDYQANSPIISVGEEAIENTGQVTVERSLAQLPQFTGSFGQSNTSSTSTGLNGGQAYASLRGLGSKRTLLLLDGRRMQPSNPDGSVDLNIIPEALIQNVEVITGGASTTYGSDATAGVVNFRLKRDFEGLTVNSQYGISDYADGESFRISGTLGGNFADGRGNAVLSVDYTKRWRALQGDRPYYFFRSDTPGLATIPQGNTIFGANRPTIGAVNTVLDGYGLGPINGNDGFYTGQIGFNTDQTLFTTSGVPVLNFRDPETDEAYIVDSGPNSQQINYGYADGALQGNLNRYTIFGKVDYELTESIRSFLQVSYVNYDSVATGNPTLASNVYGLSVPSTNPFISGDFADILASRPDPDGDFTFYKAFNITGPRIQGYTYDVYQITGGLSGELGVGDLTWNAYGSISKAKFENEQLGGVSDSALERLLYSPTGGTEYCDGGFNPFGNVTPSQECIDYIQRRTLNTNELKQRILEGSVQGGMFELPAGEVRFAIGADYRYNSYEFQPDAQLNQPDGTSDILGFSVLRPAGGSVDTTEAFAELLVPLLHDLPFIQQLDLDLGYRYSDYSSVGGVHTYKADIDWQATDWLRFRGGYNRAIRAPSVGELYAPISTGSVGIGNPTPTGSQGDPCDVRSSYRQGANADQVAALCLAQGVPDSLIDSYQLGTAQVFALTGGNPDLQEEKADTFSAGAVIRSPFYSPMLNGISLSVDWYKIKVEDAVGPLSIAQGFQFCFNQGGNNPNFDPDNYYCSLIERNTESGVPLNPQQPLLNLGQFSVSGIDVQLDWRLDLTDLGFGDDAGRFDLNAAVSYLDSFKIQNLPTAPTYDYAGSIGQAIESNAGEAHPTWKSVTSFTYSHGNASLGLRWRYIDAMKSSSQVVNPDSSTRGVEAYHIFDLNGRVSLTDETEFRVGITNLFNRKPPQVGDDQGDYDAQNYDVLGRYYFMGVKKSF